VCVDWSRPSPSSPRLAVCGPVQSNLPFGLDWTEPYPRLGPSGLVESLDIIVMASGGGQGEWSTHVQMYEIKWLCGTLGLDFDDLLLVLGLNAYSAHWVVFFIFINERI